MTFGKDLRGEKEKDNHKKRWVRGDRRACNIKFELKSGQILQCDSFLLYKYSNRYKELNIPNNRTIRLEDLDGAHVEEVIAWMYDMEVRVNPEKMWGLMKAAFYFEIDELEHYLKQVIKNIDYIFIVLNIASRDMIQEKPQNAFRGEFTFWQLKMYNRAFHAVLEVFYQMEPSLGMNALSQLNVTSIYALMYDLVDLKTKVRIVFLTIDWIARTRPSLQSIYGILGSLRGNLSYNKLYAIKWHMYMFLTKYYSTKMDFFIWMDGTSELVVASREGIAAIPPVVLIYPIDENLPFTMSSKPRTPRTVFEYRRHHFKEAMKRERICGRYEPRAESEEKYSFGEEHKNEAVGRDLKYKLKGYVVVPEIAGPSNEKSDGTFLTFGDTKYFIPKASSGQAKPPTHQQPSNGPNSFGFPQAPENPKRAKYEHSDFK